MSPTFQEPALLEVEPYADKSICCGDVIYFHSPNDGRNIVHRVVQINRNGVITQGDNNPLRDPYFLTDSEIIGKVVSSWREDRKYRVNGGVLGRVSRMRCQWLRWSGKQLSLLFYPAHKWLIQRGYFVRVLRVYCQPKIVRFCENGTERFSLYLGKTQIGFYDRETNDWLIQKPFRWFIDRHILLNSIEEN